MFHVLNPQTEKLKQWPEKETTKVLCDVKTPRDAISLTKFIQFVEQGKLNVERCCKACYRRARPSARD